AAATLAVAFLLGVLLSPAAVSADTAAPATQTVTVMPGDSLWTIATTIAPEEDVYEVIAAIDELNGLEGRAPALGEELFIPATR
ncbi:peptidoglycan-binding protein LysM, partial [Micrococcus endophyticus]